MNRDTPLSTWVETIAERLLKERVQDAFTGGSLYIRKPIEGQPRITALNELRIERAIPSQVVHYVVTRTADKIFTEHDSASEADATIERRVLDDRYYFAWLLLLDCDAEDFTRITGIEQPDEQLRDMGNCTEFDRARAFINNLIAEIEINQQAVGVNITPRPARKLVMAAPKPKDAALRKRNSYLETNNKELMATLEKERAAKRELRLELEEAALVKAELETLFKYQARNFKNSLSDLDKTRKQLRTARQNLDIMLDSRGKAEDEIVRLSEDLKDRDSLIQTLRSEARDASKGKWYSWLFRPVWNRRVA